MINHNVKRPNIRYEILEIEGGYILWVMTYGHF